MFGTYRTLLALAVLVHHLVSIPVIGHYAVHGFFILSGYLMTFIMSGSYGYNARGIKSFAINRFLRLYPSYWVILFISIGLIFLWGEERALSYRESMFYPRNILEWAQNIFFIFGNLFPSQVLPRLSPPTWALTIELFFYFLIAAGLSKSKKSTNLWLFASLIYMLLTHAFGLRYSYRYDIIFAGSLPFSIGAFIFHYRDVLCNYFRVLAKPVPITVIFFFFVANSFAAASIQHFHFGEILFYTSFYFNYLINAVLIVALINGKPPLVSKSVDQLLGDFSYPIYLFHWQAGFMASMILWNKPVRGLNIHGIAACLLAILICFAVSWLIIKYVDQPIQKLRFIIKKRVKKQPDLP